MTYQKPADLTYTDMCIYFDNNIYKSNRDDTLLFQYLYHVIYMLASKSRYFREFSDYDDFAIYAASRLYMRYPSAETCEQTELEKRLRSVLNYTKATIYPLKVDYQKEFFSQIYSYNEDNFETFVNITKENIQSDYNEELSDSIVDVLKQLPKIIKNRIDETPYRNNPALCKKLYMSSLLTFINSLTLSDKDIKKIEKKKSIKEKEDLYIRSLKREREDSIIVWHLDDSYKDYIKILNNKIRRDADKELTETKTSFNLSDSELEGVMMTAFSNTGGLYEEDY